MRNSYINLYCAKNLFFLLVFRFRELGKIVVQKCKISRLSLLVSSPRLQPHQSPHKLHNYGEFFCPSVRVRLSVCPTLLGRGPLRHVCGHINRTIMVHTFLESRLRLKNSLHCNALEGINSHTRFSN